MQKVRSNISAEKVWPVVIYLHESGSSPLDSGNDLRQISELGLAVVGVDYNQTNEAAFDRQFFGVLEYFRRQKWADMSKTAWVGYSMGAQRLTGFALRLGARTKSFGKAGRRLGQ
jgi:hypothetical protein